MNTVDRRNEIDKYAGKRVLVTGGAGFIGSHLVDGLMAAGADHVTVVDNFFLGNIENLALVRASHEDRLTIYRENAGDYHTVKAVLDEQKPEIVFNLATKALLYSFFSPAEAFSVNTDIAKCLAELLREGAYSRLVHFSSSEVYGTAQYVPMREDHPLLAETTYAAGKAAADLMLSSYYNMFDLDIVTVRPFNNYGPRQNEGAMAAIIPLTLRRIDDGEPPVIQGDGDQTRDFIYVEDTVRAAMMLALHPDARGEIFNVGSGKETSMRDIIETLIDLTQFDQRAVHEPARPADVRRHLADVSKAEALIGPMATTSLEVGLKNILAERGSRGMKL